MRCETNELMNHKDCRFKNDRDNDEPINRAGANDHRSAQQTPRPPVTRQQGHQQVQPLLIPVSQRRGPTNQYALLPIS